MLIEIIVGLLWIGIYFPASIIVALTDKIKRYLLYPHA
jgi:hypothetical protein